MPFESGLRWRGEGSEGQAGLCEGRGWRVSVSGVRAESSGWCSIEQMGDVKEKLQKQITQLLENEI